MSKARLIITAVVVEGRRQVDVAADYGVSRSWVSKLVARYRAEGEAALEPRSRRPHTNPNATTPDVVDLIVGLRHQLAGKGLDHGPDTIVWHLAQHHDVKISAATVSRQLTKAGLVEPAPRKRPKSSYIRFEAAMPNECWQSDVTHFFLADGTRVEILTFLDDCTRFALSVTAHTAVSAGVLVERFRATIETFGIPAATLTDNAMIYTVKHSGFGRRGGRNQFEHQLRTLGIRQKNGAPNHPQTQGKVERFQDTLKKMLRAAAQKPTTVADLQHLIDQSVGEYNHRRPHRSLPGRATPATRYNALPKASPSADRSSDSHDRIRHDIVDASGSVTLRVNGSMHHIGIGRTHARTHVLMLIHDLHVRIVNATTGELLRDLQLDPNRNYQPQEKQETPDP